MDVFSNILSGFLGSTLGAVITLYLGQHWGNKQALRMLGAERRLQAQQEAYSKWWRLQTAIDNPNKRKECTGECQTFWFASCLYLSKKTRTMFKDTLGEVIAFNNDVENKVRQELYNKVCDVLNVIEKDANLPDLNPKPSKFAEIVKKALRHK